MAQMGCTVHVAVYDFNRTLITDSYAVTHLPGEISPLPHDRVTECNQVYLNNEWPTTRSPSSLFVIFAIRTQDQLSPFLPQEDPVPVYEVTVDTFSKRFVVTMETCRVANLKLCYENRAVCDSIQSHKVSALGSQIRKCNRATFLLFITS